MVFTLAKAPSIGRSHADGVTAIRDGPVALPTTMRWRRPGNPDAPLYEHREIALY